MERMLREQLSEGKFTGTTPQRSKTMQAISGKNNRTTERRLRLALVRSAVRGWKVRPAGLKGNPDFVFPAERLAVFVDGCYWHGCPKCGHIPQTNSAFWRAKIDRNRERDRNTTSALEEQGFRVLRFWEHDLRTELDRCIEKVRLCCTAPAEPDALAAG